MTSPLHPHAPASPDPADLPGSPAPSRASRRRILTGAAIAAVLAIGGTAVAIAPLIGLTTLASSASSTASKPATADALRSVQQIFKSVSAPVSHSDILIVQLPTLALPAVAAAAQQPAPAPAPVAAPAPTSYSISIATFGRQAALDQCVWVRMSFSAAVPVPFVAAHNYCGGGIVLDMQVGQIVTLSGTGLDGTYVVSGGKDAWSGMEALDAMAGLSGDVILQSCYWSDDGRERLIALTRT